MNTADRKAGEKLMDIIGDVSELYIREYMEAQNRSRGIPGLRRKGHPQKLKTAILLAAVLIMLLGTVSVAAVSMIGHFLTNQKQEQEAILKNYTEIERLYGLPIDSSQECGGVKATLNSAVLEDHYLLLSYTFDWSGLEDAQDGSFHTWFLPWFFHITEGDTVICNSEYTRGLHTEVLPGGAENDFSQTFLYCIDLGDIKGSSLTGKELSVRFLYARDSEGFADTFTPESCFKDREWQINETYEFQGHEFTLQSVRESALYVTLFMDRDAIGRAGDEYLFILSDELGRDYTVYPYETEYGQYWFTKPDEMGGQLVLKIVRSALTSDSSGEIINDSYDVLREIPIELK